MGMGFWLFEDIKYDPVTGKNLSRGTWEYKVPSTKGFYIMNIFFIYHFSHKIMYRYTN